MKIGQENFLRNWGEEGKQSADTGKASNSSDTSLVLRLDQALTLLHSWSSLAAVPFLHVLLAAPTLLSKEKADPGCKAECFVFHYSMLEHAGKSTYLCLGAVEKAEQEPGIQWGKAASSQEFSFILGKGETRKTDLSPRPSSLRRKSNEIP